MKFKKKYYGGEFSTLIKMYDTDRKEPQYQSVSWNQTEEIEPDGRWRRFVVVGQSRAL